MGCQRMGGQVAVSIISNGCGGSNLQNIRSLLGLGYFLLSAGNTRWYNQVQLNLQLGDADMASISGLGVKECIWIGL